MDPGQPASQPARVCEIPHKLMGGGRWDPDEQKVVEKHWFQEGRWLFEIHFFAKSIGFIRVAESSLAGLQTLKS